MANDTDGRAAVACHWSEPLPASTTTNPWSVTEWRPAGVALARRVICVMEDTPLAAARVALDEAPGSFGVPVVDARHRLVGFLPRAAATLALLGRSRTAVVAEYVKVASATLAESESLREAFRVMGSRHSRELLVVNDEGEMVGVIRDIDALQLVAAARRAPISRP